MLRCQLLKQSGESTYSAPLDGAFGRGPTTASRTAQQMAAPQALDLGFTHTLLTMQYSAAKVAPPYSTRSHFTVTGLYIIHFNIIAQSPTSSKILASPTEINVCSKFTYVVSAPRMRHGPIMQNKYACNTEFEILKAAGIKVVAFWGHDTVQIGRN